MGLDLTAGLLGAVMGGSNATNEIARDKRKELAEKLKMEARAELERQYQSREHEFMSGESEKGREFQAGESEKGRTFQSGEAEKGRTFQAGEYEKGREFQSGEGDKDRSSTEKMAAERNSTLKQIADREHEMRILMLAESKKGNQAAELRAQVAAFTEARKVIEGGGSTDEANAVLEAAGLPGLEDYVIDPGSSGFFGFGGKDPVMGRRVKGSGGSQIGNDLEALLVEGSRFSEKGSSGVAYAAEPKGLIGSESDEPMPQPKGVYGGEQVASLTPKVGDPKSWEVVQELGKYFLITDEGPIEMSPEQIEQWKAANAK